MASNGVFDFFVYKFINEVYLEGKTPYSRSNKGLKRLSFYGLEIILVLKHAYQFFTNSPHNVYLMLFYL